MAAVADEDPLSGRRSWPASGRRPGWVAADRADRPVGYIVVEVVDGNAHIEQVSVHPDHARQGWAGPSRHGRRNGPRSEVLPALTLTASPRSRGTRPYDAGLGSRCGRAEFTEGLAGSGDQEDARGLHAWPRVAMRRPVAS